MAFPQLKTMELVDLKKLQKEVDQAITTYEDRRKSEAIMAAEAAVKEFGFKLTDLVSVEKGGKKPIAAKYKNPENPLETWTGRGRKPKWVSDALASGKKLEDLAI